MSTKPLSRKYGAGQPDEAKIRKQRKLRKRIEDAKNLAKQAALHATQAKKAVKDAKQKE